jgi:hypothetical protein
MSGFALHTAWNQLIDCTFYSVDHVTLPPKMTWRSYADIIRQQPESGFEWVNGEERVRSSSESYQYS